MFVLDRIGFYQNRRDETPNQELARELAAAQDADGMREIAENHWKEKQRPAFLSVLAVRLPDLGGTRRAARVKKVIRSVEKRSF